MSFSSLNVAWNGVRFVLREDFSFNHIKEIVGLAGTDITGLTHLVQRAGGGATKGQLMDALDAEVGPLDDKEKERVLVNVAKVMIERRPEVSDHLARHLGPLGWNFEEGRLFPVEVLDVSELIDVPEVARTDLVKAASRYQDGDLSGVLTAACAAVDSATNMVYSRYSLGDPTKDGFQARCKKALDAKNTIGDLARELGALGWDAADATRLGKNMQGSLNQGAFVMQSLRSKMSDVHGTKGVLRTVVFDAIKWASLIISALK